MEQRFFFGLLMLGEGNLTPNYLFFCFVGSVGVLQFVAGTYARRDLLLLPPRIAQALGIALVIGAFAWFFLVEPGIFIPGLAGGELLTFSLAAFLAALIVTRGLAALLVRIAVLSPEFRRSQETPERE